METDWVPAPEWREETLSYFVDTTPNPLFEGKVDISVGYMRSLELRQWVAEFRPSTRTEHPNLVPDGAFFNKLIADSLDVHLSWDDAAAWETTQLLWSLLDSEGLIAFYPALSVYDLTEEQFYLLFDMVNSLSREVPGNFFDFVIFTRYVDVLDQFFMNPLFSSVEVFTRLVKYLTQDLTEANKLALTMLLYSSPTPYADKDALRDSLPSEILEDVYALEDTFDKRWLDARPNGSVHSSIKVTLFLMQSNPNHASLSDVYDLIEATEILPSATDDGTIDDLHALLHIASAKPETSHYMTADLQERVRSNLGRLGYNWVNSEDPAWRMQVEPAVLPYIPLFTGQMEEIGVDPSVVPADWVRELFI